LHDHRRPKTPQNVLFFGSKGIVRRAIEAFDYPDESKFSISGPDIRITSGAVIAGAMTLNELCTNTTKFGALSVPEGRVDITWTLDPIHSLGHPAEPAPGLAATCE
jgi:hypothetical protein